MDRDTRGVLYPAALPTFHRLPPPEAVAGWVRWFWIPEWSIAPGRTSRQELIAFPASNLVVEPELVGLSGPTTRLSHRDITGTGWAVGALLRPAAVPSFLDRPAELRDAYRTVEEPELHAAVAAVMTSDADPEARRERAVAAYTAWLLERLPAPDAEGLLANAMADLVDADPTVVRVEDAATALGVSVRTLQRLASRYVGLSPSAMIRRRRLQETAQRIRNEPGTDLASVAAELGYADHAHLTREFRTVLGFTPSRYRGEAGTSAT